MTDVHIWDSRPFKSTKTISPNPTTNSEFRLGIRNFTKVFWPKTTTNK